MKQYLLIVALVCASIVSAHAVPAIDGQQSNAGSGSTYTNTTPLVTANSNDVIIVALANFLHTVTGCSGSTLGAFTLLKADAGGNGSEVWYKVAGSPLAGETVTCTWSAGGTGSIFVFGVSGTTAVFDANGTLPFNQFNPTTPNAQTCSPFSTTSANDFVFAMVGAGGSLSVGTINGVTATAITGSPINSVFVQYIVASGTLSSATTTINTVGNINMCIVDALPPSVASTLHNRPATGAGN